MFERTKHQQRGRKGAKGLAERMKILRHREMTSDFPRSKPRNKLSPHRSLRFSIKFHQCFHVCYDHDIVRLSPVPCNNHVLSLRLSRNKICCSAESLNELVSRLGAAWHVTRTQAQSLIHTQVADSQSTSSILPTSASVEVHSNANHNNITANVCSCSGNGNDVNNDTTSNNGAV